MKYYSTRNPELLESLDRAVIKGLAPDGGLFMPQDIKPLPSEFFEKIQELSPAAIAFRVISNILGEDVEASELRRIVEETLSFPCPVVKVKQNIYALELFHGPTLAFKDFGAR